MAGLDPANQAFGEDGVCDKHWVTGSRPVMESEGRPVMESEGRPVMERRVRRVMESVETPVMER